MSQAISADTIPASSVQEINNASWLSWLKCNVDTSWRPNEWNHDYWLFTGSVDEPGTATRYCSVKSCNTIVSRNRICSSCKIAAAKSPLSPEEFEATYIPERQKLSSADFAHKRKSCDAKPASEHCPRTAVTVGLCTYHHQRWRQAVELDPGLQLEHWRISSSVTIPILGKLPDCQVPACNRDARSRKSQLCEAHLRWHRLDGYPIPLEEWASIQIPVLSDHQFSLINLDEVLKWEIMYALQQRDARGGRIEPYVLRLVVGILKSNPHFSSMSVTEAAEFTSVKRENNTNAHLAEFSRYFRSARDRMLGIGPKDQLVWDLVEAGVSRDPSLLGGTRRRHGLDFRPIVQPWLRDLTLAWAREQTSPTTLSETVRATTAASQALAERPDQGHHIALLSRPDVTAITERINLLKAVRGDTLSSKHKWKLYQRFFNLIAWGRQQGLLDELPIPFVALPPSYIRSDDFEENETGRSIPSYVQQQLDQNIDLIGRDVNYGRLIDSQAHTMFRAAYCILRDTGRRPLEVASLRVDCLTRDSSGAVLIWDNHKAKRYGRRLPILQSTADEVQRWIDLRPLVDAPKRSDPFLFPAISERADEPHMRSYGISRCIRLWVDRLGRLDSGDVDDDSTPIPFDRSLIFPYAFRHGYAQRHADGGTPVDVLRELMDHKSIKSTSGYYTISTDRKRDAINTVGPLAIDRFGNPHPHENATSYQMQSVAVPFGNCIESTNVKAGGQSCPIRFQCSGCGYYRPDPSYIPAIEEHLITLRADREIAIAMGAASYVIDNLTAQVDSFETVLGSIRERLSALDIDEQERVENASAALRRARAGEPLPLSVKETRNAR